MSSEEGTKLKSGRVLGLVTNSQPLDSAIMSERNTSETESVEDCSGSSRIAEIKESHERQFNGLQSEVPIDHLIHQTLTCCCNFSPLHV